MCGRTAVRIIDQSAARATRCRLLGFFVLFLLLGSSSGSAALDDAVLGTWTDPLYQKEWTLRATGDWLLEYDAGTNEASRAQLLADLRLHEVRAFDAATHTMIVREDMLPSTFTVPQVHTRRNELRGSPLLDGATPVVEDAEGFRKYFLDQRLLVQLDVDRVLGDPSAWKPGTAPRFSDRPDRAAVDAACRERIALRGATVRESYWTPGLYQIEVSLESPESEPGGGQFGLFAALNAWLEDPSVLYVEPAYLCFDDLATPNDPLYPQQWGMRNPGPGSWKETADVRADAAWWVTRGDPNVILCFIDTGMDMNHEDLAGNLLPRNGADWDFVDADSSPDDVSNHGTCVTGIAGAIQNNAKGISGLAPSCRLMPLRVSLTAGQHAARIDAINYAASRRDEFTAMVLNCSWGNSSGDFTGIRAAIQNAHAADCVIVCAAGNENGPVIYPARYVETIAVGATSPCDERKRPSSCDGETFWGSCFGPELDVVAPGVVIQTTDRTGGNGYSSTSYFNMFNGTSASTSFVSALAGLIYSVAPGLSNEDVRDVLESSATDQVGLLSEDGPGFDSYMGHGRIDAYRAVLVALSAYSVVDDMESGAPRWQHVSNAVDPWRLAARRNHTPGGSTSWEVGVDSTGSYPAGADGELHTPDLIVPPSATLRFFHAMHTPEVGPGLAGDGGLLELTTDGGETWTQLLPFGGYTHVWSEDGDPLAAGTPVFAGSFDWKEELIDLVAYAGETVRIRFRFASRSDLLPDEAGEGWFVDDVTIDTDPTSGVPGETRRRSEWALTVSPNPAREGVRIRLAPALEGVLGAGNGSGPSATAKGTRAPAGVAGRSGSLAVRVEILDVSGRRVATVPADRSMSDSPIWRPADDSGRVLPSGTYIARATDGTRSAEARFVWIR